MVCECQEKVKNDRVDLILEPGQGVDGHPDYGDAHKHDGEDGNNLHSRVQ